jgi:hypothetical protein
MSAGRKSSRSTPLLGLAFFTSAITAASPAATLPVSTSAKPRVAGACSTRPARSRNGNRSARAVISSTLRSRIFFRISGVSFMAS